MFWQGLICRPHKVKRPERGENQNFSALQRLLRFRHKNCRQSNDAAEFELGFVTRHQQIGATRLCRGNMKDIKRAAEKFPCMKAGQMGCAVPNDRPIQHFHGLHKQYRQ